MFGYHWLGAIVDFLYVRDGGFEYRGSAPSYGVLGSRKIAEIHIVTGRSDRSPVACFCVKSGEHL
jgi:hypothetical protein